MAQKGILFRIKDDARPTSVVTSDVLAPTIASAEQVEANIVELTLKIRIKNAKIAERPPAPAMTNKGWLPLGDDDTTTISLGTAEIGFKKAALDNPDDTEVTVDWPGSKIGGAGA